MRRVVASTLLSLLLVGGCADSAEPPPDPVPRVDRPPAGSTQTAAPNAIKIPGIGVESTLIPVGLNPDRTMTVPPVDQPWQAAWYSLGPTPGAPGPAVIVGHVDGIVDGVKGRPGVFRYLEDLAPRDLIYVTLADGVEVTFVVTSVESFAKAAFPTDRVYGNTAGPELRLVTCGGVFDRASGHYAENTIVFARSMDA